MGRYMTVVIKEKYRNDAFLDALNEKLKTLYGATTANTFNTWKYLQEEADYINKTKEGKKQLPGWKRPITKEVLHENFFWLRMGEYSCKISSPIVEEAKTAIAVCKWIQLSESEYIDRGSSNNYSAAVLHEYLDSALREAGLNTKEVWKML